MIARWWRFGFPIIFGLGFTGMASGETSFTTALGLTLGFAFTVEAAVVAMTIAGPTVVALSEGMAASLAAGGVIGAVNLAALGVVGAVFGLVGIAIIGGIAAYVLVPAIVARSTAGAGASGEGTNDTAAANDAANDTQALAAAVATLAQNPVLRVPFSVSVNPATGELTVPGVTADGVTIGDVPGSPPGSSPGLGLGLSLGQVSDTNVTNPGENSGLPAIGESVPGPASDASVNADAYGWIDGVCREYATGLECDGDDSSEYEHHRYVHHTVASRAIPAPAAVVLLSLGVLMMMARRVAR